jgi:hypothetical protein
MPSTKINLNHFNFTKFQQEITEQTETGLIFNRKRRCSNTVN